MSFEESVKELEKIAEKLEGGNCPLDEAVALYEKAVVLTRECNDALKQARLKITELNVSEKAEEN